MVSADGMDDVEGHYLVSGDKYRIEVQGGEHISDGKVRYEISHDYREIVIDNADSGGNNLFANPARTFEFADDQFRSEWLRSETHLGKKCDVVKLQPVSEAYGFMSIMLYIDSASGLPVSIKYDYGDDPTITIAITAINKSDNIDSSTFAFRRADYPDYEVIDFR
jgi:outer membrane lipoprotein-sorting protein